jgi:4-carboxymuconolactone decarboxylase
MEPLVALPEIRWAGLVSGQGHVRRPYFATADSEIAILVTGAKFRAAYEIYAHVLVAELGGLPDDKLATIVAGQRPSYLTPEEAVAYDVASALVSGGVLPELTYRQSVRAFGEEGTAEIISLVGLYCMVSVTLNGFDVPVPEVDARKSSG